MSFILEYKELIESGDTAIVYTTPDSMLAIQIKAGEKCHMHLGMFEHNEMIGKPYGSTWWSKNRKSHVHVLHPTPELWTVVLAHRTQIIYMPDAAFIGSALGLKPGAMVVESGTGSGSLSHHFLRTIAPSGHLFTFEYHKQRAEAATIEFRAHGLADHVTVACRDVCAEGFGLANRADAVFLDLPSPWKAIPFARAALRRDKMARLCSFSPCIEQVQQTRAALLQEGFQDIYMVEVVVRPCDVRRVPYRRHGCSAEPSEAPNTPVSVPLIAVSKVDEEIKGHTSFLTFAALMHEQQ